MNTILWTFVQRRQKCFQNY